MFDTSLTQKMYRLFRKEKLFEFENFLRPVSLFEEVPIWSRDAHVAALRLVGEQETTHFLVNAGLLYFELLSSWLSFRLQLNEQSGWFLCITLQYFDERDCCDYIMPSVFYSQTARDVIVPAVRLLPAESDISNKYLSSFPICKPRLKYDVFAGAKPDPECERLYLAPQSIPGTRFISIERLIEKKVARMQ